MQQVTVEREVILLRCLDLYENKKMDFADVYLVAYAEKNGSLLWHPLTKGWINQGLQVEWIPRIFSRKELDSSIHP
jgi:hypothetical protein